MASHHRATAGSSWATSSVSNWGQPATAKETLVAYIGTGAASTSGHRACDPSLHEPNLSLELEIADLINSKKANTPRDAAVEVVKLVNHRNTHVAMLALHLLDILVKNCGYPFHLQISTKEFLNELVRRFPERPPTFPPPPMKKILELVHEWKNTICVTSKHKEDLVHIRDMHRLLSYKGYRFPQFDRQAVSVLNPTESLRTPDELEEEDREAQAAKLQELIRRGTPKDLAAAQELMKIMAGAEPEKKPDYEEQVSKELDRVQQRVLLLNEMLNNANAKERFVEGDAYDQIAQKCRHVQPKLQKWIADSSENHPDSMDRLLLINDLINNVIKRYEAFKAGDRSATAEIDPALAAGSAGAKARTQAKQVSLIDFDDDEAFAAPAPSPVPARPNAPSSNPLDDLASLSLGPSASGAGGGGGGGGAGSLFDLGAAFSTPSSSVAPSATSHPAPLSSSNGNPSAPATPQGGTGGTFFSNPAYQNATRGSSPFGGGGGSLGSISLGSSSSGTIMNAMRGGGMGGGGPPVPPKKEGAGAGTKKDAFADLLGDF
ncbi:VHS domain containing protein [Rhodotorula toruloides]|uniref:VHS domain containing protein n=1 Tax=Rhodotorula toruloides TaxID=5286 RepID=A0A511KJW7_RHOTO|nr:VHS domain containing protein [Rhodotorula toruloides]